MPNDLEITLISLAIKRTTLQILALQLLNSSSRKQTWDQNNTTVNCMTLKLTSKICDPLT